MKRFLAIIFLSLSFITSCKKDGIDNPTSGPIQIQVTGLSATTDLNLTVACKCGRNVLTVTKQLGNKTYETLAVKSGDDINVVIGSSIVNDNNGNGSGDLKFIYNGSVLLTITGNLMGPTGKTASFRIP